MIRFSSAYQEVCDTAQTAIETICAYERRRAVCSEQERQEFVELLKRNLDDLKFSIENYIGKEMNAKKETGK